MQIKSIRIAHNLTKQQRMMYKMTIKNKIRTALQNCEPEQYFNGIRYFCQDDLSEIAAEIRAKKIRECRIDKMQSGYQVIIRGAWLVGWLA